MSKPITKPNTFAPQVGPIPLSQLDSDFDTLYTAINDPSTYSNYLVDSGSANVIVVTYPAGISYAAYKAGDVVTVKVANTNGLSTTLNINGLGAKTIKNPSGSNMSANQLVSGGIYTFFYDGTNFQILGFDTGTSATFTGNQVYRPTSGTGITANGVALSPAVLINSNAASGQNQGLTVTAGTTSADWSALFKSAGAVNYFQIRGDGLIQMNEATLGTTGTLLSAASYESGTFTGTLTGMTATTTGTINWVRTGNLVSLYAVNNILGTSNTTGLSMTGLPTSLQPANPISVDTISTDNGVANVATLALVTAGTILFFKMNGSQTFVASNYTNSGSKGLNSQWTMTYPIQ